MIYTVTLNPAIDCFTKVKELKPGEVNRGANQEIIAGGKGINISIMLNNLGIESTALGFLAGATGEFIEAEVLRQGIKTDFVRVNGLSRINIKLLGETETEVNGEGPKIEENELRAFLEKIKGTEAGDTICLSGSIPQGLPHDIYKLILENLPEGVRTVCDARGELLRQTLEFSPFLVKPNVKELAEFFEVSIENAEDAIPYAKKLKDMGAQNVLVSLGADGAVLVDENEMVHFCPAADGTVVSAVSAGDSMIAGFLRGIESGDFEEALLLACACGSATAFSHGIASGDYVFEILKRLE